MSHWVLGLRRDNATNNANNTIQELAASITTLFTNASRRLTRLAAPPTQLTCSSCHHVVQIAPELFLWTCDVCRTDGLQFYDQVCPACQSPRQRSHMPLLEVICDRCSTENIVPQSEALCSIRESNLSVQKKLQDVKQDLASRPPQFHCQTCATVLETPEDSSFSVVLCANCKSMTAVPKSAFQDRLSRISFDIKKSAKKAILKLAHSESIDCPMCKFPLKLPPKNSGAIHPVSCSNCSASFRLKY